MLYYRQQIEVENIISSVFPQLIAKIIIINYRQNCIYHPQLEVENIISTVFPRLIAEIIVINYRQNCINDYRQTKNSLLSDIKLLRTHIITPLNRHIQFGQTVTVTIPRDGDILSSFYHSIVLPRIS